MQRQATALPYEYPYILHVNNSVLENKEKFGLKRIAKSCLFYKSNENETEEKAKRAMEEKNGCDKTKKRVIMNHIVH